ncbi:MAG TPA: nuclear transport factor 2 family protein [Chthoniobacterales bacterium]
MTSPISHEAAEKWARSLYEQSVDRKDAAGFAKVFAPNGSLRFGNNPPLVGRAEIESAIGQFFQAMASLRHEFVAISCDGDMVFLEAKVTYTRHDAATVTVPAMTVFVMANAANLCAQECRIYVDLAPLFAPTQN